MAIGVILIAISLIPRPENEVKLQYNIFMSLSAKEEGYRVLQSSPYSSKCYYVCT